MKFSRCPTSPAIYAKLAVVLVLLSLFVCGAGCSRKREVTGQVFVVNAGGQNIRLGLVAIHVVDREQLISATEQAVTNSSGFFRNLDITAAGSGAESFWSGLPSPVGLTDAEGEFRVSIGDADMILARTSILIGGESKQFIWVIPGKNLGELPVLLSNHNLFEGGEASMALISSLPGIVEVAKLRRVAEQSAEKERELSEIRSKSDRAARSSAQAGKQAAEIAAGKHPLVDKSFGRLVVASNAWAEALIFAHNAAASAAEANAPLVATVAEVAKAEAVAALQVAKTSAQDAESAEKSTAAKTYYEVAVDSASKAKTASGKAFEAAHSAEAYFQDIAKVVQPPDKRLETVGRFAASAKDSANDAAEASRQAELYAQAAKKSVAMKETLESAVEAALAAVDARIRSQRASTLASKEFNSARASEALAAAKAASLAASQAESSLDQVKLALQRSRTLMSADLPKLVREAGESKDIADQNSKEASRALVEFESAASEVPKLVIQLSANTANRAILEFGTNTAAAIRENLKQGQAMVAKIAEAVEATARGHQNADEAFVSSLVFLVNELADSVEINSKTAKGLADSLSNTNISVADAEQILDRVEAVRQMVELESITVGRIKLQLNNKVASSSDPHVDKAVLLARDANFKAAERLIEITASAVKTALNDIKIESNKFAPENSTNLIKVTEFAGEQQRRLEGIKAMLLNAEKRLQFAGYPDIGRLINGMTLLFDEAGEIVSKANDMVLTLIQKRLPHVLENASREWSQIEKETRTRALEDSKGRLKMILDEQNQLNGIAEIYQSKEGVQNQTKEMLRSAIGKVQTLIDRINFRVNEIRVAEDKAANELREKFEEARSTSDPGKRFVIGFAVRWLPPGSFNMGSPSSEQFRDLDETPHQVVFPQGFFISETECTQAQWELVMGTNPSAIKGTNRPVEKVSWYDAVAYCQKLTDKHRQDGILPEGWIWRLPTEAEWEYAARAGTTGVRYGDLENIAWYSSNSGEMTHEVKLKQSNAFGLYDMIGNVMEWCSDWYGPYPTGVLVAPTGPISGSERVFRGGSWGNDQRISRSADRNGFLPDRSYFDLGFRPVLSPVR